MSPVMAKLVVVALVKSELPKSVLEANNFELSELNGPEIVVDPVTANALVVPLVNEKLRPVSKPVLETLRSVEVAVAVDEPIANSTVLVPPLFACSERLANGEVVPIPKLPVLVMRARSLPVSEPPVKNLIAAAVLVLEALAKSKLPSLLYKYKSLGPKAVKLGSALPEEL